MRTDQSAPGRHRRWGRSFAIGLVGALLTVLAWLTGTTLQARADHRLPGSAVDGGLALIAFLGASAGSASLCAGGHLLDRVTVAERWRAMPHDRRR